MVRDKKPIVLPPPDEDGRYLVMDDTCYLAELPDNYDEILSQARELVRKKDREKEGGAI